MAFQAASAGNCAPCLSSRRDRESIAGAMSDRIGHIIGDLSRRGLLHRSAVASAASTI